MVAVGREFRVDAQRVFWADGAVNAERYPPLSATADRGGCGASNSTPREAKECPRPLLNAPT